jgi:hypothetical protein
MFSSSSAAAFLTTGGGLRCFGPVLNRSLMREFAFMKMKQNRIFWLTNGLSYLIKKVITNKSGF